MDIRAYTHPVIVARATPRSCERKVRTLRSREKTAIRPHGSEEGTLMATSPVTFRTGA